MPCGRRPAPGPTARFPKFSTSMPAVRLGVVEAYRRKTFDEFKERYHSLDLLLIDDVQFFADEDRTQEELFDAFEALLAQESHRGDQRHPTRGAGGHPRAAVSRCDSGPDGGDQHAGARDARGDPDRQARAEDAEMPEEVAFFVADVRSDVRELEGALRRSWRTALRPERDLDRPCARGLRDLLSIRSRSLRREHAEVRRRLLQDRGRRRVLKRAASIAGRAQFDVPGQS